MWVLAFEAALVLALIAFIIWWTLPRKKNKQAEAQDEADKKE